MMNSFAQVQTKFQALGPFLDEKTTRLWAATEAQALGWGGVTAVAQATGLSRATIHTGQAELRGTQGAPPPARVRRAQVPLRHPTGPGPSLGSPSGTAHPRGAYVTFALDLQKYHTVSRRITSPRL